MGGVIVTQESSADEGAGDTSVKPASELSSCQHGVIIIQKALVLFDSRIFYNNKRLILCCQSFSLFSPFVPINQSKDTQNKSANFPSVSISG